MEPAPEVGHIAVEGGSRRGLLVGLGLVGLGAVACGKDDPQTAAPSAEQPPAAEETGTAPSAEAPQAAGGQSLGKASAIPVGGGLINKKLKVVVTQPSQGVYEAFSAVCTHAGCTVAEVSGGEIICPCHGSKYAIKDGSVVMGPADQALAKKEIKVEGGRITLMS